MKLCIVDLRLIVDNLCIVVVWSRLRWIGFLLAELIVFECLVVKFGKMSIFVKVR